MNTSQLLRCAAAAAIATLAGTGARAAEATQWDPQADARAAASTDATLSPTAWPVNLGEATQFHDGMARDTIAARGAVHSDLKVARGKGLLDDTGEGGASDRVLARRDAFNAAEHDRLLALNAPASDEEDEIARMAAAGFGKAPSLASG
jgi:hypothetical protein